MTSERKAAANRRNGRKGRGPRTAAGKSIASRNALRHGLTAITHRAPAFFDRVTRMARAIRGGDSNPLLIAPSLVIAESELLLQLVRKERVAAIERLRSIIEIPIGIRNNTFALIKAKAKKIMEAGDRAYDEYERMRSDYEANNNAEQSNQPQDESGENLKHDFSYRFYEGRDEFEAMEEAAPDLNRLARYQRRASSRQKRAIVEFMNIKFSMQQLRLVDGAEGLPTESMPPRGV